MDNIQKEIGYAEGFSDGQYANSERIRELEAENKELRKGRGVTLYNVEPDDGYWYSCSGCHETNQGAETGDYPYHLAFQCHLGVGCSECGGLGAVWNSTKYSALSPAPVSVGEDEKEGVVDTIEEIISETHDIDVTDRRYAENVVAWLERHHPAALRALIEGEG